MNCMLCKFNLVGGNVEHILNFDGHTITIKGVPANICGQCGEYFIENDIALKIEKIIKDVKENKAELLVINYSEIVAKSDK